MIKQFRNLNLFNIIFLFVLLFVLRVGIYLNLPNELNSGLLEFFSRLLLPYSFDTLFSPIVNITIAAVIVFVQALIFNKIVNNYNLLGKTTFLPALFYVVASSILTPFLLLSPQLICNFFLLFILHKILLQYKNPDSIATMFDLGMVVALGTLFYFPFVAFMILLWIALTLFRPFNFREWSSAVIGYATIMFFLGVYYFWNDKLLDFYEIWKPLSNKFPFYIKVNINDYIVLIPILGASILGIIQIRINYFRSYILVRKAFQFVFSMFLIASLSFYLKSDFRINHFLLAVIPFAFIMAYYFGHASKRWWYESFFMVTLGFILYFQFI